MSKGLQIKVRNTNSVSGMRYLFFRPDFVVMCHFQTPNCFILSFFEQSGPKVRILQHENENYRFFFQKEKKNKGGIWKWNTFLMTLNM